MTRDVRDPAPRRRRRRWVVLGIAAVITAAAAAVVLARGGEDHPVPGLTVGWGGSEGHSSCRYDPGARSVEATLLVDGYEPRDHEVTVTVTAYADENTSKPVGSASRTVQVRGAVHERLVLTIPVERPPQVGEDDVVACALDVAD